jgi:hypothetical protein
VKKKWDDNRSIGMTTGLYLVRHFKTVRTISIRNVKTAYEGRKDGQGSKGGKEERETERKGSDQGRSEERKEGRVGRMGGKGGRRKGGRDRRKGRVRKEGRKKG